MQFQFRSTGEFHFPNDLAAEIAIDTVKRHKGDMEVRLLLFHFSLYLMVYPTVQSFRMMKGWYILKAKQTVHRKCKVEKSPRKHTTKSSDRDGNFL